MDYRTYLNHVYASWLGKIIGIRLGAPVEAWTHQRIVDTYGEVTGYLVDYDLFAADDDSNGPLFFARALLDFGPCTLSAEDIGNTFLNYIQEYQGFFWWGGLGISTEHTAYENLKQGIKAPASGSVAVNGRALAEQIGGQIFSDCWGYVSGYDPDLARSLAIKASSVSHDGNGIQGGIFVAVAIALAFNMTDAKEVVLKTLDYLDEKMEYSRVVRHVLAFHDAYPDDWRACLDDIQKNFGYDKYPGVCHIIPNATLMIMALCYGGNDFSKTLTILCEAGWDTDCNCGNVGSIMGALEKLENIEPRWIEPINDTLNCSSMIGCLNNTTVSKTARMFANLAFSLMGREDLIEQAEEYDFSLPYATCGFRARNARVKNVEQELRVVPLEGTVELYRHSYYLPGDLYDTRYEPSFSPSVYPNETLRFLVRSTETLTLAVFVRDGKGRRHQSKFETFVGEKELSLQVPSDLDDVVWEFGLCQKDAGISRSSWCVIKVSIDKNAAFAIDFSNLPIDRYGETFSKGQLNNIRGWVVHSGNWEITDKGLMGQSTDQALITSGDLAFGDGEYTIEGSIVEGQNHSFIFCCGGYQHYYAVGFEGDFLTLIEKDVHERILKRIRLDQSFHKNYILKMKMKNGKINVVLNGQEMIESYPLTRYQTGIFGFLTKENSIGIIHRFKLTTSI